MRYIGIDPGANGGIAVIDDETGIVTVAKYDPDEYRDILRASTGAKCCVENVWAMPGQGVSSMFSFGKNFGFIQGMLHAYSVPYSLVSPSKWKSEFGLITKEKNPAEKKKLDIAACKRMFPFVDLRASDRCKKPHDGIADALLIAEYARRRL